MLFVVTVVVAAFFLLIQNFHHSKIKLSVWVYQIEIRVTYFCFRLSEKSYRDEIRFYVFGRKYHECESWLISVFGAQENFDH